MPVSPVFPNNFKMEDYPKLLRLRGGWGFHYVIE